MMMAKLNLLALGAFLLSTASAQFFQRLGTCPTLGCILPPDQQDCLPGQEFDIRFEVHAPLNGTEAFNDGVPDDAFTVTISKADNSTGAPQTIAEFFNVPEPEVETWTFSWYEDLFAQEAGTPSVVNVASKIYRRVALYEPGEYVVSLGYYGGESTVASWTVRPLAVEKKAKNVILFIGDGMTTNMITAARLLGHKSVNGRYQSKMQLDKFPVLGHQMTHSLDTYITDSANSASALYSGHKSSVNAMGVYVDSSPDLFDDPKVETLVELLRRVQGSAWGAVSTAFLADATPIALTAHTRSRYTYGSLIDQALHGLTNYSWTHAGSPDVYFGGGAEQFLPGSGSYLGKDYYAEFAAQDYSVALNKTSLEQLSNDTRALGVFCKSNLPVWLDRNVFTDVLDTFTNDPTGANASAQDLPGLKEMTLKAVDILNTRGGDAGFFLMSEAASIDKQMHALDYDRALGDLLELDDTVRATIERLGALGILEDTLVLVTADHGHGFDVFGSADTEYMASKSTAREKRDAIGVYQNSGLSQYTVPVEGVSYNTGPNFPVNWDPRYVIASGAGASPDRREDYRVSKDKPRTPAVEVGENGYMANPAQTIDGFVVNGTLPVSESQGVHSLTDVPVFAMGPCQELFGGVYSAIDVFYGMASCLGLGQSTNVTKGLVR
ncbi:hypothetical protein N0V82_001826 [Gnomoniopsis sp. IMI 355080]|nr:hypothetical protein N0V82_001826 [Gnomoniopsis sp. IMI 355080]